MNPALARLYPYPFERLRVLLQGVTPPKELAPINMGIGEPQHPTPPVVTETLKANLALLGKYPASGGTPEVRNAIASWAGRRYGVALDPDREVLPVSGSREALFGFAQAVLDPAERPVVLLPNPFYQIYEGAAFLAGAEPFYVPTPQDNGYLPDWSAVPATVWPRVRLAYVCSPGNPTGAVFDLDAWREAFAQADKFGFVIAADECYSEIYNEAPPVGALQAAKELGRGFERLVVFNSLSKRSSAPGLRSGFVAGDAEIMEKYLLYRTYHGAAPALLVQAVSAAAWADEAHVEENRAKYRAKFEMAARLVPEISTYIPPAAFFLWPKVGDDEKCARDLYGATGVTVVPGSYLARESGGVNPGAGHVRIALVAEPDVCEEALLRIRSYMDKH